MSMAQLDSGADFMKSMVRSEKAVATAKNRQIASAITNQTGDGYSEHPYSPHQLANRYYKDGQWRSTWAECRTAAAGAWRTFKGPWWTMARNQLKLVDSAGKPFKGTVEQFIESAEFSSETVAKVIDHLYSTTEKWNKTEDKDHRTKANYWFYYWHKLLPYWKELFTRKIDNQKGVAAAEADLQKVMQAKANKSKQLQETGIDLNKIEGQAQRQQQHEVSSADAVMEVSQMLNKHKESGNAQQMELDEASSGTLTVLHANLLKSKGIKKIKTPNGIVDLTAIDFDKIPKNDLHLKLNHYLDTKVNGVKSGNEQQSSQVASAAVKVQQANIQSEKQKQQSAKKQSQAALRTAAAAEQQAQSQKEVIKQTKNKDNSLHTVIHKDPHINTTGVRSHG